MRSPHDALDPAAFVDAEDLHDESPLAPLPPMSDAAFRFHRLADIREQQRLTVLRLARLEQLTRRWAALPEVVVWRDPDLEPSYPSSTDVGR